MNVKLVITILTISLFLGGGMFMAIWVSQKSRMGESIALDDNISGEGGSHRSGESGGSGHKKGEDSEEDTGEDAADKESQLSQQASQREADLRLFLEEPYFRLPVITIPILRNEKLYGILHLRIVMKSVNHDGFQTAKVLIPRIVDAIFENLYVSFANLWLSHLDPTAEIIQKRLEKTTLETLGAGKVDQIYVKEFFFTRNRY